MLEDMRKRTREHATLLRSTARLECRYVWALDGERFTCASLTIGKECTVVAYRYEIQ